MPTHPWPPPSGGRYARCISCFAPLQNFTEQVREIATRSGYGFLCQDCAEGGGVLDLGEVVGTQEGWLWEAKELTIEAAIEGARGG